MSYVGLDTETVDGRAVLVCTPERVCLQPRGWADLWRFLKQDSDYITWNVSYDARAILAYLPGTALTALRRGETAEYRGWRVEYVPRKRLAIRKGDEAVRFWDAYPYYESSLDNAASCWLGARKLRIPYRWLSDMSKPLSRPRDRERVIRYCCRDARLTQELWEMVAAQYQELGIDPYRAASPASLATRAFPESYDHGRVPGYVQGVFRRAYYGGRTEIYSRGNCGRVWCYDIHSAYPSVLSDLIDPACTEPVRVESGQVRPRPGAVYGAYRVTVTVPLDARISPIPFRPARGPLVYPAGVVTTWVTLPEMRMLARRGFRTRLRDGLELVLTGTPRCLFPDVTRYYRMRREVPAVSHAVKKLLNSVYGKLAETRTIPVAVTKRRIPRAARMHKGRLCVRTQIPTRHTHFAVAGAITGAIRARLYDAMMLDPEAIVAVHTDGIVARRKLDLSLGNGLGDWGLDHTPDTAIVIGCGVYVYRENGVWTERTRGLHLDKPLRSLRNHRGAVGHFRLRHANTLADAERTGWATLNRMETIGKGVDANMDRKRVWPKPWASFRDVFTTRQDSEALIVVTRDMLPNKNKKRRALARPKRK